MEISRKTIERIYQMKNLFFEKINKNTFSQISQMEPRNKQA